MADVLAYLASKGLHVKSAPQQNIHTTCFFCGEDPTSRGRLYISVDPDAEPPGLYKCFLCDAKGNLTTLKRHFGDPVGEREQTGAARSEIFAVAATHYHDTLERYSSVAAYLKGPERGLNADTIVAMNIGYAPMDISYNLATKTRTVIRPTELYHHLRSAGYKTADILATGLCQEANAKIVDSLAGMVTIPYLVAGQVVTIRGRTWPYTEDDFATWEHGPYDPAKAKYKTLGGSRARLYNTDVVWGAKEITICEGELDALALQQMGYAAVGVPGAQAWQDEWDGYLTNLRRIFVIFDRDPAGERGASKLLERFGPKVRRIFLSAPGVKCDPTTWCQSHTAGELAEIYAEATKGGLLVTVHDAIEEFRNIQSQPGLRFGWEPLDSCLNPGLQPAQLMVVLARPNCGKTVLLLNLMHQARMVPGQEQARCLFLSLEQTRGEWWDRARRIHRFYDLDATETDTMRWWERHIRLVDRNHLKTAELTEVIEDYEYDVGGLPDLICLDYLGYWGRGFKGEAYERTSAAIHALKRIIKDYRIPLIVPQQVSRSAKDGEEIAPDNARDSGAIEETADFVIGMWRPEDAIGRGNEPRDGLINFKILKSRHGGRGMQFGAQFSPVSLAIAPLTDPLHRRAANEQEWHRKFPQLSWEEIMLRHEANQ